MKYSKERSYLRKKWVYGGKKKNKLPLDTEILRSTWEWSMQEVKGVVGSRFVVLNIDFS